MDRLDPSPLFFGEETHTNKRGGKQDDHDFCFPFLGFEADVSNKTPPTALSFLGIIHLWQTVL